MTELTELNDNQKFAYYAKEYELKKANTLIHIIECGKVLHEAKNNLSHGMFINFLSDSRVNESPRTSQRLMSIYRNFRHLLNLKETPRVLAQLGVTHLLELQKLPDRFKKEIEVIEDEKPTIVQVIDEELLFDFLDKEVEDSGETVPIKDLPLSKLKKYINEAQGIFNADDDNDNDVVPDKEFITDPNTVPIKPGEFETSDVVPIIDSTLDVSNHQHTITDKYDSFNDLLNLLSETYTKLHIVRPKVQDLDNVYLETLHEDQKPKLKKNLDSVKDACESLTMQLISALERLD